ncbi:hypothetical protein QCA50_005948 [Cerrena zonata]|uniref:Uncharacterized protein n=1 Tax=Cerrena zonata TaxID=2478898 RepID=A0AAW0GBU9_9APHY
MAEQLDAREEELLQAALDNAFGPSSLPALPVVDPTPPQAVPKPSTGGPSSDSSEENWKTELEALEASWKEVSAKERAHAEVSRKKWEEIRAKEAKERKERGEPEEEEIVSPLDWIDAGGLVTSEGQTGKTKAELEAILPGSSRLSQPEPSSHDRDASEAESSKHEKWEELSSDVTSSYPSMSFPSDPHSPSSQHQAQLHPSHSEPHHHHLHQHGHHAHEESSPTFAIFDSRLSRKTRALALFSSLAINLLLPFVNGVMLGFGEIFARNVVGSWFGWKTPARPGSVAAGVGLGRGREKRQ